MIVLARMMHRCGAGGSTQGDQQTQGQKITHHIRSNRLTNVPWCCAGPMNGPSRRGWGEEGSAGTVPAGHWGLCNHPLSVMCVRAAIDPRYSGFTISHIGGIMGHARLTRRRDPDAKQETWLIHYGDVHAGMIEAASTTPSDAD